VILVAAILLVALSVPALGGSLSRLGALQFTAWWTIVAALAIQVVIISVIPATIPTWLAAGFHLVSYALAVVFLWRNRRVPWLWVIALGGMANLTAISANGGVMPASARALAAAGRSVHVGHFRNSTALPDAHLRFLGDIFSIPKGWPLANVFSIGDILLVVGSALLLHAVCRSRPARRWTPASPRSSASQSAAPHSAASHSAAPHSAAPQSAAPA
jgi:hypothetical protein